MGKVTVLGLKLSVENRDLCRPYLPRYINFVV